MRKEIDLVKVEEDICNTTPKTHAKFILYSIKLLEPSSMCSNIIIILVVRWPTGMKKSAQFGQQWCVGMKELHSS
jgi:hypothetical protein